MFYHHGIGVRFVCLKIHWWWDELLLWPGQAIKPDCKIWTRQAWPQKAASRGSVAADFFWSHGSGCSLDLLHRRWAVHFMQALWDLRLQMRPSLTHHICHICQALLL
jgi:hypothetical protein